MNRNVHAYCMNRRQPPRQAVAIIVYVLYSIPFHRFIQATRPIYRSQTIQTVDMKKLPRFFLALHRSLPISSQPRINFPCARKLSKPVSTVHPTQSASVVKKPSMAPTPDDGTTADDATLVELLPHDHDAL